ncbi:hypothetical protein [Chryseobacterium profundimaris]|uniref:Uncharacterized protein n=1 Tax=Chryseobacterium profundimaris TaxID=1387275 RepID=A0ABY1NIP4_9FLAO|nr:hypothetical protein [Chryseobacterium profundimaris]SMP10665.1 hypothetical protein SAMN06264346_102228 [Chryseobacterium profundimaris]
MKQKTLIQIWGKARSGKTTTIKMIKHELEKKYINVHHTYSLPLAKGEIYEIFNCNGFVIGVSSMGDILAPHLRSHLNDCFLQCDIIIAASRVYNSVDSFLRKEAKNNNFRLIKATNYRINDSRTVQDELSQESAKHIVDLIDKIMRGII